MPDNERTKTTISTGSRRPLKAHLSLLAAFALIGIACSASAEAPVPPAVYPGSPAAKSPTPEGVTPTAIEVPVLDRTAMALNPKTPTYSIAERTATARTQTPSPAFNPAAVSTSRARVSAALTLTAATK